MRGDQLIMDLTLEQGPGRETQVQPPLNVWIRYFNINFSRLPTMMLMNRGARRVRREVRRVVEHHHNWTVELSGAAMPRPAILRMWRTSVTGHKYDYWVYRPRDPQYAHCNWMLNTFSNPFHDRGRRWLII